MGLDNYFVIEGTDTVPILLPWPDVNLCGGMFSGHGDGSFRGKVYADIVEQITGVSLYEDRLSTETLEEMADALNGYIAERQFDDDAEVDTDWGISFKEIRGLAIVFGFASENNLECISWW